MAQFALGSLRLAQGADYFPPINGPNHTVKAECLKLPRPPLDDPTKAILWTTPIYWDQRLNCYLFHLQSKNDNDSCYSCFTEDPTALFQYPRSSPDAVLKFVTDIFSSRDTSEFFYALDMKVLIEIVLRQMADLSPGAGVGLYLSALYLSFYIFISILLMIHEIILLAQDCSKLITWPNIP